MKLFLIGATGNIGSCIRDEALARGHLVTGMTRDAARLSPRPGLSVHRGDALDRSALAAAIRGHDAVVVAHGSMPDDPNIGPNTTLAAVSILGALRDAGIRRVFWVGGAGSLFDAEGRRVLDAMELPPWARSAIWWATAITASRWAGCSHGFLPRFASGIFCGSRWRRNCANAMRRITARASLGKARFARFPDLGRARRRQWCALLS